jgi:alpha-glucosidase (family GH31 glycosyl hydrolase)
MDTNGYPNPASMVSSCQVYGVKLIPLIEPWLEPNDPYYSIEYGDLDFIKDPTAATRFKGTFTSATCLGSTSPASRR